MCGLASRTGKKVMKKNNFAQLRQWMVEEQLLSRDIADPKVIKAMSKVPRQEFVPQNLRRYAYRDSPLLIGFGQTISQPYIVALMCQFLELKGNEKVLDIGTGLGYQAAVLGLLAKKVISIERIRKLAESAKKTLKKLDFNNVKIVIGDGSKGVPDEAPFDAIICAAATSKIPKLWKEQLKEGGRVVLPLEKNLSQYLVRITKKGKQFLRETFCPVAFVPLISC